MWQKKDIKVMSKNDILQDIDRRVEFIRGTIEISGTNGIVFGNSGGKDSALTGILCKMACVDTLGVIMPCQSKQNYNRDKEDAELMAARYGIATKVVDLTKTKQTIVEAIHDAANPSHAALANIAPRLRMTTLYAIAATENRLVAGTGNRSESHMGYFTKWGDGAYDFNPIADLTVTEIYDYLRVLEAPISIIEKSPSAGLFDGQTDEQEMGISYRCIDSYLLGGTVSQSEQKIIEKFHGRSIHKRQMPLIYLRCSNNSVFK